MLLAGVEWVLSWLLRATYEVASAVVGPDAAWGPALAGLAVVVRAAMAPVYVAGLRATPGVAALADYSRQLRAAYPHDRARRRRAAAAAAGQLGVRRWARWVPAAVTVTVTLGLYRLLADAVTAGQAVGGVTAAMVASAGTATVAGVPLTATLGGVATVSEAARVGAVGLMLVGLSLWSARQAAARNTGGRALPADALRLALVAAGLVLVGYVWLAPFGVLLYSLTSAAITAAVSGPAARYVASLPAPQLPNPDVAQAGRAGT